MSDANISQMNDKQLRNEVQLLRDELAIFKRKYEDIIHNLDNDNFSSTFLREKDGMKTSIEINAEGIKTKVSNAEFESAKTQLANEITSKVNTLDWKLSSQITQTATEINQKVDNVESGLSTEISQTASEINSTVSALSGSVSSIRQTANSVSSRVNNIEDGEFNGYTLFEQTGSKFSFTGNVEISGDAIVEGTISADRIDTDNLSCTRLYAKDNSDGYSVRLNGSWGDFGIFTPSAANDDGANDFKCMFGVYNSAPNVNFLVYGHNFMGYDVNADKIWTKGTWDFSTCDVIGIEGGGGTAKFA